ncbi:MAG: hypothetical protein H0V98_03770, partial [Chloroflexia bacterium]|nr:hypothetical protein [Chloroflexia bacterium]
MKPTIISPQSAAEALGLVIAEEVRHNGKRTFRKGHRVTADDLAMLAELDRSVHAVQFEPGDVHEDDAAMVLARLIAGEGVDIRPPVQSRANLNSAGRGLLRIDSAAVTELNLLPGIAIFTTIDRLPVSEGHNVAGAKITPVAVPSATLERARAFVDSLDGPIITIKPFVHRTVGVLATEGLSDKIRDRFEATVCRKLDWYGSDVL